MAGSGYILAAMLVLCLSTDGSHGAKILGLFPFPAKSHMISFTALMQELARRGHDVTTVSAFPVKPPIANHTDIVVDDIFPEKASMNLFEFQDQNKLLMIFIFSKITTTACERALKQPQIQKLIHDTDQQYDVIIYENMFSDCFHGFIHKFKAPAIYISPNSNGIFLGDNIGNPHTTSYIPSPHLGYSDHMNFCQRLTNTVLGLFMYLNRQFYHLPMQDALIRQYFNDPTMPPITDIARNASLLLLNSHVIFNSPRPFTPNTVDVGGMHIKPGNKLPQDLQKFMDQAPHGVIYFSLGSNVRSADMPEKMRLALLDNFSRLKQRVLWKWETDSLPGQPANVRLGKWLPQNDILAHKNVRLFITHGGLLSTQETTYHGVPLLAIPIMADQKSNALQAQASGYALMLELSNITTESLSWALNEVLTNPSYRENVKRLSDILRDQPQSPLDRAVYWTEYVIRHKGAPHLRSAALDLWWFQYYLLDILAVVLGAAMVCMTVTFLTLRAVYLLLVRKPSKKQAQKKKTN